MSVKRMLLRYAWIIGFRELARTRRVEPETKVGAILLAGLATAPFVIAFSGGAMVWWLLTGRRLPGRLGRWIGPPAAMFAKHTPGPMSQLPPDVREWFAGRDAATTQH